MRFPASLLLKVFFCSTKSWLLGLIVKNTHLNIASQVKMHIKMNLKVHFKHRKLVKIFYLCLSLDKIVDIKFLSPPHSLYLPCQVWGSGKTSPSEGITDAMPTHQKGTVSLGEATHDPQFSNALQEN
jgi:hypothetical protein